MTIKLKISLAFVALFLVIVFVSLGMRYLVDSLAASVQGVVTGHVATMAAAGDLQMALLSQMEAVSRYERTSRPRDAAVAKEKNQIIVRLLPKVERVSSGQPEGALIRRLKKAYRYWWADASAVIGASAAPPPPSRTDLTLTVEKRMPDRFAATLSLAQQVMRVARANALAHSSEAISIADRANSLSFLTTVAAGIAALALVLGMLASIVAPLNRMLRAVRQIGGGDYSARTRVDTHDELGALSSVLDDTLNRLASERSHLEAANEDLQDERRRSEEELELARRVQLELLPEPYLASRSCDVFAVFRPVSFIGGDFYRFVERDGIVRLALGDVAGHGVPAALAMAASAALLEEACEREPTPASVLSRVNELVDAKVGLAPDMFVTCLVADWNPGSRRLSFASAGHPLPLVLEKSGQAWAVTGSPSVPLGLQENSVYRDEDTVLSEGDRIVAVTDGLIEMRDSHGDMLGEQYLVRAMSLHARLRGPQLAQSLVNFMESAGGGRHDDETLIVVETVKRPAWA